MNQTMTLTSQPPDSGEAFDILVRGLTGEPRAALFLDVDGTLLDIAPRPDEVVVPPSLRASLARIHDALDGALALVSGRPVDELDRLFAPLRLPAAGAHGAHWRTHSAGRTENLPGLALPAAVRSQLLALQGRHRGLILEYKLTSTAIHLRESSAVARAPATALGGLVDGPTVEAVVVVTLQ